LQTCAPLTKKVNEEGVEEEVEEPEFDKVFEDPRTYVHIKLTLNNPAVPPVASKPEPGPSEIVPVKQFITWPYSKDPCDDFGKQVTLAVESLAKEFCTMFRKQIDDMASSEENLENLTKKFEDLKKEFFYEINT